MPKKNGKKHQPGLLAQMQAQTAAVPCATAQSYFTALASVRLGDTTTINLGQLTKHAVDSKVFESLDVLCRKIQENLEAGNEHFAIRLTKLHGYLSGSGHADSQTKSLIIAALLNVSAARKAELERAPVGKVSRDAVPPAFAAS